MERGRVKGKENNKPSVILQNITSTKVEHIRMYTENC
jgi:hypothetical protein